MKLIVVVILLAAASYFGYQHLEASGPRDITDPVFAEIRIDMNAGGRELNLVLFGKMADEQDCRTRAAIVWSKTISGCKECEFNVSNCLEELAPRYAKLFEDQQIQSTYLSFTRGNREERDGRMVIYGLTADEGNMVCEVARAQFQREYTGQVTCIEGRRD